MIDAASPVPETGRPFLFEAGAYSTLIDLKQCRTAERATDCVSFDDMLILTKARRPSGKAPRILILNELHISDTPTKETVIENADHKNGVRQILGSRRLLGRSHRC